MYDMGGLSLYQESIFLVEIFNRYAYFYIENNKICNHYIII